MPMGTEKTRKWVLSLTPSLRTAITQPLWYVDTKSVIPSSARIAGRLAVWTLLEAAFVIVGLGLVAYDREV